MSLFSSAPAVGKAVGIALGTKLLICVGVGVVIVTGCYLYKLRKKTQLERASVERMSTS